MSGPDKDRIDYSITVTMIGRFGNIYCLKLRIQRNRSLQDVGWVGFNLHILSQSSGVCRQFVQSDELYSLVNQIQPNC